MNWYGRAVVGVSLTVACTSAWALPELVGLGAKKCGEFTKATQGSNQALTAAYLGWAQGFMSSLNMARDQQKKQSKIFSSGNFKTEQQLALLMSYCSKNPSRDFAAATIELYKRLPVRN